MKNIYIAGYVRGAYRTQVMIKYLLDNNYLVYYNSLETKVLKDRTGVLKIIRKLLRAFEELLKFCFQIYQIGISDIVIIPAMCNDFQIQFKLACFFRKTIISDYYISLYDTAVLDRKTIKKTSKAAKKLMMLDYNIISKSTKTIFLNTTEANRYLKLVNLDFDKKKHLIVPLVVEESMKCNLVYFKNNQSNKVFKMCWWGTYIPLHGIDNILNACKLLKDNTKLKFHLYMFGNDDNAALPYKKIIESLGISEIVSIDNTKTFKNGKLGEFLKYNCDLVLGNFGDSDKAKNVLVNKLIDGVAMKAPVLTGESIAPLEFFSKDDIFYSNNDPKSIASNIIEVMNYDEYGILLKVEKAYEIYENHFSINAFENKIKNVLSEIQ